MTESTITVHGDEGGVTVTLNGESRVFGPEVAQRLLQLIEGGVGAETPFSADTLVSFAEAEGAEPEELTTGALIDIAVSMPIRSGGDAIALGPRARAGSNPLSDVLAGRRSERQLARLELDDLATLLFRSCRVVSWSYDDRGIELSLRPHPSAGALHPLTIEVLAQDVGGLESGSWAFDPMLCSLVRTDRSGRDIDSAIGAIANAARVEAVPAALVALANPARTLSRYPRGTSLVWRDVGALLATLHLTATDLGLASSIVGTCGVLERFRGSDSPQVDLGAVIVGAP